MSDDESEVVEAIRFPELAAALQKDPDLSNEARIKLVNLTNVYAPEHDVSYLKTVQTFVGKSLMARAVEQLIKDLKAPSNPPMCNAFVDPIEGSDDNGERLEYLKRITMEEPKKPPRVRACRRPRESDRAARNAARRGHERRERGTRPTRARR